MKMLWKIFGLLVLVCLRVDASIEDGTLEDVLKDILKIKPPDSKLELAEHIQPPKHMLELYNQFTNGKRSSEETIRYITPNSEATETVRDMLLFGVGTLGSDEEVGRAQLVVRRRRLARHPRPARTHHLAPPARVRLFHVLRAAGPRRPRALPLASIPVPQVTRGGWHTLDITTALRELLLSSFDSSDQITLGVRFEAPKSKILSPSHFLDQRDNTSAFLMIYTGEDFLDNELHTEKKKPTITQEHILILEQHLKNNNIKHRHHTHRVRHEEPHENPRRHKNKNNDERLSVFVAKHRIKVNKKQRHEQEEEEETKLIQNKDDEDDDKSIIKSNLIDELLENSESRRVIRSVEHHVSKSHKRRSIYDNEVSIEKYLPENGRIFTSTSGPEVVTELLQPEEDDDGNLIPYPAGAERKKRRRGRRGKRKNRRNRTTKIPDEWNKHERHHRLYSNTEETNSTFHSPEGNSNSTCSRRQLVVSFQELGWSSWILAPKFFNAHYCSGVCSFPVPEHKRSKSHRKKCNVPVSNHAVIQGLVHQLELHKDVPAPCCVPDTLSPLTILYMQDHGYVILKNYRSMTVETCGCR